MLLDTFLSDSAERYPDKTALVFDDTEYSYQWFNDSVNGLAANLTRIGLQKGERVVIWLGNSLEQCLAIYAALRAGGAFVPIHQSTKVPKLKELLDDCRASVLITSQKNKRTLAASNVSLDHLRHTIVVGLEDAESESTLSFESMLEEASSASAQKPYIIDRDLASLIYTSGSTGKPKAVMCAHYNMVAAARSITTYLENVPEDVIINGLPLSFDYGLYQLLMSVLIGGTLVLEPSFAFPMRVIEHMRKWKVTGLPGVPSVFSLLLQLPESSLNIESLSYISNTGAALPVAHIKLLRQRMPDHVRICSMYGQTECKRTLYLPPRDIERKPGSVGIAIPNEEAYLVDEDGNRLPPGNSGELVARGANVMLGYWERPEETAKTYIPGPLPGERLLKSGDLFRQDSEGYFYFIGRQDDIIKSRGQKVSPKELEAVLYQIPAVKEVAIIGVPHPEWGEAIHAHVAVREGETLSKRELLAHAKKYLEDFMIPREVVFHDSLPKTDSGKVSHAAIRKQVISEKADAV